MQFGEGTVTRGQARRAAEPQPEPEPSTSGIPAKRKKLEPDKKTLEPEPEESDEQMSEPDEPEAEPPEDVPEVHPEVKAQHGPQLFTHETLVASNDLLDAYVIKEHHKKQKIFK